MQPVRLAIIGAGPSCTYVLERLAATAGEMNHLFALELHIFDKTGEFGAGQVHSATQPSSSLLNRIVGQVAFAADESVEGAGPLLPKSLRPTLYEWCRAKFAETGESDFDLTPESWPKRYVHGLALRDMFHKYLELLRRNSSIHICLHHCEVTDIVEAGEGFQIATFPVEQEDIQVEYVLFLSGHSYNDPRRSPVLSRWLDFGKGHDAVYVPYAYPLEHMIPDKAISVEKTVGCIGMGLTAIDVILYLTEGRGGRFELGSNGRLAYKASGSEPASIVAFGNTGLFTFARPYNAKEKNPQQLEHKGVFLTKAAIDKLRNQVGVLIEISQVGLQRQLNFEKHVFPILLLEMAYLYYKTLFGADFAKFIQERTTPTYESFLADGGAYNGPEHSIEFLLEPLEAAVDEGVAIIDRILSGETSYEEAINSSQAWSLSTALSRYVYVVFGPEALEQIYASLGTRDHFKAVIDRLNSPWDHHLLARDNRFCWRNMIYPIPEASCDTPEHYRNAMLDFMARDLLWASQNNLDNPAKAAADGVWRDLRSVLAYAVDFGGLTAESHRKFLSTYMRYHNRLANGAALEIMEKMRALIEHGLLDVSIGPRPEINVDNAKGQFRVYGPLTKAERFIDVLIEAKVHAFDPEEDILPIYQNLYRRGLVRKWRNPSPTGQHFEPGGLDLTSNFHPIRADGSVDRRMTFLGPPTEGVMFFQLGALRPNQNHHVMQDILCWMRRFWDDVLHHATRANGS